MGAIPALKGFRTQFLYSLNKILSDYEKGFIYLPEGEYEDLDIKNINGDYIEIIQIKNQKNTLVFSDLFSKEDSFFDRANQAIEENEEVKIKLVSFNTISEELKNKELLSKKLENKKFKKNIIEKIIQNFEYEIVDEETLIKETLELLKGTSLFSDPNIALDILIFWIYKSAETNKAIFSKDLIINLEEIGKFIKDKESFNITHNNTIIPLNVKSLNDEDLQLYKETYYCGVSAKYEHILANLDVIRDEKLRYIADGFLTNNVVFVHGASGQGKSTLAYRFLKDYTNDRTIYELKISNNLEEVYETINSLEALSKGLKFPITVYIDIIPQSKNWNEIIKELYGKKNLKFLVTIRQEDWNRVNNLEQFYEFKNIELFFNKNEAEIIYNNLSQYKIDLKFTDFEESWKVFGEGNLLLEYIYLINQGKTLKARLKKQVQNIKDKVVKNNTFELKILRYVSLSDVFNSKINYKKIIKLLNINEPAKYIQELQKEYLLQYSENKEYLQGLHPIRSKILCEILFDEDDYTDIYEYINNSLPLIDEEDLHFFLLHSFEKGYDIITCIKHLDFIQLKTWVGYKNVLSSLLWKGVYSYIFEKNITAFEKLRTLLKNGWYLGLPLDFSGVMEGESIFTKLQHLFPENINQKIIEIQKEFTEKELVFQYVIDWLNNQHKISITINNKAELEAFVEFLFWKNYLNLNVEVDLNKEEILFLAKNQKDIEKELSLLLFSIQTKDEYDTIFIEELKTITIELVRKKYNVISFKDLETTIDSIYFYNILEYENKNNNFYLDINGLSVELLDLFRYIFPEKEIYSTKGIFPVSSMGIELKYDPSEKKIRKSNLPIPYLLTLNQLTLNLFNLKYQYSYWIDYINKINERRNLYNQLNRTLIKAFTEFFKTKNIKVFIEPIDEIKSKITNIESISLPNIDYLNKWGYKINKKQNSLIDRYKEYNEYKEKYFTGIENFLRQLGDNIINIFNQRLGNKVDENYNPNIILCNIKDAIQNHFWFKREYEKFFGKYNEFSSMYSKELVDTEGANLIVIFSYWKYFYNNRFIHKAQNAINEFKLVKENITIRFKKERLNIINEYGLVLNVKLEDQLEGNLVITNETKGVDYLSSILVVREFLKRTLYAKEEFSLKKIVIDSYIKSVIYIPLKYGNPYINQCFEISLFNLDEDVNEDFYKYIKIPDCVKQYYSFEFWDEKIPLVKCYQLGMGNIFNINFITEQLNNIKRAVDKKDFMALEILNKYKLEVKQFLNDKIQNEINMWKTIKNKLEDKDIYNKVTSILNRYIQNEEIQKEELNSLEEKITNNFFIFSDKIITEYSESI